LSNDHTQSLEIAGKLRDSVETLRNISNDVAAARQIREYSSERRKNILSKYMSRWLLDGKSVAMAEALARSDDEFLREFTELSEQSLEAEKLIAQDRAEQCRYEAYRSLLSFSKSIEIDLGG
jgi:hypothetical protein